MKQFILAILPVLSLISALSIQGQSFQTFDQQKKPWYDEFHFGVVPVFTIMSNPEAPYAESHRVAAITMQIYYKKYNLDKGDTRMFWQNRSIGDLLSLLVREIRTNEGVDREEGSVLSDLIGSTSWGWNVNEGKRLSLAAGFNLNDYIIGATYAERLNGEPVNLSTGEPQGYYWTTGPSLFADFVLTDQLVLQTFASYSISMFRLVSVSNAVEDKSYPKPHFVHLHAELQTTLRLFAGVDYTWLVNRGDLPNQTRRLDFFVGYRF